MICEFCGCQRSVGARCECELKAKVKELTSKLETVQRERDVFAPIVGRVCINNCIKCGQEYPQFSILSNMTCPECKRKDVENKNVLLRKALLTFQHGNGHMFDCPARKLREVNEPVDPEWPMRCDDRCIQGRAALGGP